MIPPWGGPRGPWSPWGPIGLGPWNIPPRGGPRGPGPRGPSALAHRPWPIGLGPWSPWGPIWAQWAPIWVPYGAHMGPIWAHGVIFWLFKGLTPSIYAFFHVESESGIHSSPESTQDPFIPKILFIYFFFQNVYFFSFYFWPRISSRPFLYMFSIKETWKNLILLLLS